MGEDDHNAMKLTRRIPGHFYCDGTATSWLADAEFDVAELPAGTHPVTFTAIVSAPGATTATISVRSGGAAEEIGTAQAAVASVAGPCFTSVAGASVAGVDVSAGKVLLHVCAATSDASVPVDVAEFLLTIGTDD